MQTLALFTENKASDIRFPPKFSSDDWWALFRRSQLACQHARPRPAGLDYGPEQSHQTKCHDGADQTIRPKHLETALRGKQRLAERLLRLIAKHDREHHRRQRVIAFFHEITGNAKHEH